MLAWGPRDSGPTTDAQHCVNTSVLQFTSFPVCWAPGEGDQCQQGTAKSEICAQVCITFYAQVRTNLKAMSIARRKTRSPGSPNQRAGGSARSPWGRTPGRPGFCIFWPVRPGCRPRAPPSEKAPKTGRDWGISGVGAKKSLQKNLGWLDPRFPPGPAHPKKVHFASGHSKGVQIQGLTPSNEALTMPS